MWGWLRALIRALPTPVRYFLTLVAFWPTALFHRVHAWLFPQQKRLYDRVTDNLILGAVPLYQSEIVELARKENVRGIVNCCREWNSHAEFYPTLGLQQLHLPIIDFDIPTLAACLAGCQFIKEHADKGNTVYVHCKAGRGRSNTIVMAYLVLTQRLSPQEADALIRKKRSHISSRVDAAPIQELYRMVQAGHNPLK